MTSHQEPVREVRSRSPSVEEIEARQREGWRLLAIEWVKRSPAAAPGGVLRRREIPYGLRISEDRQHLEEDSREVSAMILMLAAIADDQPLSNIAELANEAGHRTRQGAKWTQLAVFNLLPRLIEVGADVYASVEWEAVRSRRSLRVAG